MGGPGPGEGREVLRGGSAEVPDHQGLVDKTDKQDARNLGKALWVHVVTGEFGFSTVYKPAGVMRALRQLSAQCRALIREFTRLKNGAQAIFVDDGVELFTPARGLEVMEG